jgi:hypothetical protein
MRGALARAADAGVNEVAAEAIGKSAAAGCTTTTSACSS